MVAQVEGYCGCGGGGWRQRGKAAAVGGLSLDELCCVVVIFRKDYGLVW